MRRVFVGILSIVLASGTGTSAQDTVRLTLEAALERGLSHSYALRNQQLAIDLADSELDKLKARKMPVISAGGDLRTNIVLPVTIIPGSAFNNQGQNEGDRKIRFGTTFNIIGSVEAAYALVDPTLSADRALAEAGRSLQGTLYEAQKQQQKLVIAEAWYNVFLHQEQTRLASDKLMRARALLEINQVRQETGALLPAELLRTQLDVDNAAATFEQAVNQLILSRQTLAYQVGLPLNTKLEVKGAPIPENPETWETLVPGQRWEISEQQQRMVVAERKVQQIEQQYKPGLNLYGPFYHYKSPFPNGIPFLQDF